MVDDGLVFFHRKTGEIILHVSNKNRGKMASSNWKFADALPSATSSSELLEMLSALEASKFYFNHR